MSPAVCGLQLQNRCEKSQGVENDTVIASIAQKSSHCPTRTVHRVAAAHYLIPKGQETCSVNLPKSMQRCPAGPVLPATFNQSRTSLNTVYVTLTQCVCPCGLPVRPGQRWYWRFNQVAGVRPALGLPPDSIIAAQLAIPRHTIRAPPWRAHGVTSYP
ncbi:hypothetical protein K466DRAFT_18496 [Polyporus arcularius HHB13444]|uniref:Uncharacterized protein n=1 Tax=Polyporus arcularius HHB13444 TaxID=1314778 RepID=A0A5C3PIL0_9APHY|nr:hypothetical protein K466DRAFT_18496 [Polyporus arcularius HHB13444]